MYCAPISQLDMIPPLGAITGTISSSQLLDQINTKWGNPTGVIFGQPGDPFADKFKALATLVGTVQRVGQTMEKIVQTIEQPMQIRPITCEEDLRYTPESMYLPILLYKPIRELFEDDRISGYGFEKENLPEEDYYGRLIHNGEMRFTPDYEGEELPDTVTWEFKSSDPDLTFEELDAIDATRKYLDTWLEEQFGPEGSRIDPTDLSNHIRPKKKK